ncbi:hypothetical protein ACFQ9V_00635 [Leifsonia sp. NPDC056665]|uniref:hypothetical protein n=1 Tax=Leifsonia sp. NPDC056665 TaxID=3345901 RepID=UPI0036A652E7
MADAALSRGIVPLSPRASDVPFDVAWIDDDVLVLVEVKSLTLMNERDQLRYGLGQLAEYAHHYRADDRSVRLFLVVEGQAPSSRWSAVARSVGVEVVGEHQLDGLFVK